MVAALFVTLAVCACVVSAVALSRVLSVERVFAAATLPDSAPSVLDGPRPWEVADPVALDCYCDYDINSLRCHSCPFADRCQRATRAALARVTDARAAAPESEGGDDVR